MPMSVSCLAGSSHIQPDGHAASLAGPASTLTSPAPPPPSALPLPELASTLVPPPAPASCSSVWSLGLSPVSPVSPSSPSSLLSPSLALPVVVPVPPPASFLTEPEPVPASLGATGLVSTTPGCEQPSAPRTTRPQTATL